MKYFAILKDSLREALDSKVLYFTAGLSCLVILAVASVSYRPQPAEQGLRAIIQQFPGAKNQMLAPTPILTYEIENFEALSDTSKPWEGTYRFRLIVTEQQPLALSTIVWFLALQREEHELGKEDRESQKRFQKLLAQAAQGVPPEKLKEMIGEGFQREVSQVSAAQKERFIKEQFAAYGSLEATKATFSSPAAGKAVFDVEAQPKEGVFLTWPHKLTFLFGAVPTEIEIPIGPLVFQVEDTLVGSIGAAVAMLLSTVITAFFIPNMLRKGTIDLLIAKPVHRTTLLIYKFIGGLSFMFVNTVFVVVGIWVVIGLRSGLWAPSFLLMIFIFTFQFAIFYAVSTLFGVLTRSPIVSILAACCTWAVLFLFHLGYVFVEVTRPFKPYSEWVYTTADTLHFVLPRYKDLDYLSGKLLARDLLGPDSMERKLADKMFTSIKWGESLGISVAFIALMLGVSCWRFATKDY